jgi:hypothetical protein
MYKMFKRKILDLSEEYDTSAPISNEEDTAVSSL